MSLCSTADRLDDMLANLQTRATAALYVPFVFIISLWWPASTTQYYLVATRQLSGVLAGLCDMQWCSQDLVSSGHNASSSNFFSLSFFFPSLLPFYLYRFPFLFVLPITARPCSHLNAAIGGFGGPCEFSLIPTVRK